MTEVLHPSEQKADTLIADILMSCGDAESAIAVLQKVRDVFSQTSILSGNKVFIAPRELAETLLLLGDVYRRSGQRDFAVSGSRCQLLASKIALSCKFFGSVVQVGKDASFQHPDLQERKQGLYGHSRACRDACAAGRSS